MSRGRAEHRVEAASAGLVEHGYAVLPALYDAASVARFRAELERLHRELGCPSLYSREPIWLGDTAEISGTGLVIHEVLARSQELHRDLLAPEAIGALRGALGEDMFLEFAGAVICDHTRPFFEWHNHLGGIDDEKYRRLGLRPRMERPERVSMIIYLDEMSADTGQLLIYPRRLCGSSPPPYPVSQRHWQGELAVSAPAGTVVLMDQCSWHAVLPRVSSSSLRMFLGLWFASRSSTPSERIDRSLDAIRSADAIVSSVLRTRNRDTRGST